MKDEGWTHRQETDAETVRQGDTRISQVRPFFHRVSVSPHPRVPSSSPCRPGSASPRPAFILHPSSLILPPHLLTTNQHHVAHH